MTLRNDLAALGSPAKPALDLLHLAAHEQWHAEDVEKALGCLARETHRLKDSWAETVVDRDRKVRAAYDRALDCTTHGKTIAELEQQVHHYSEAYRAADLQRGALVAALHHISEVLDALQKQARVGRKLPPADRLVEVLVAAVAEAQGTSARKPEKKAAVRPRTSRTADAAGAAVGAGPVQADLFS